MVGPDGVGKTTLAQAICRLRPDDTQYFHFRPSGGFIDPEPGRVERGRDVGTDNPRFAETLGGFIRIAVALPRFWVAYLWRIRPVVLRGGLVLGDRWAYGYLVSPAPLGYHGPRWLARLAVAAMPRPDLVVNLTAPVTVIAQRKPELDSPEISRELAKFRGLAPTVRIDVDGTESPDTLARMVLDQVCGQPKARR